MLVLSMSTVVNVNLVYVGLVNVNPCLCQPSQVLRESRIRKGTKSILLSTHQNQPTHSYQYLILQKKKVPFLWMQFVNSEFTFILVPCQLLPSKSQVAFCHFSRWESEHQISDIHQENPKIHPQIWRRCPPPSPPMSRPFLSHIFPSFQDPRPLTIVSLSDVCFFPTNQINWRPWTEIEGHWSGIVVSNDVLNSGSNWRERATRNILCFYPGMLLVPISNPHLHLYFHRYFQSL